MIDTAPLLKMEAIGKSFPGVRALQDVDFDVRAGEVHALMGENGAGKSTLMKIVSGAYHADTGRILIDGGPITIRSPHHAMDLGIQIIYQELNLAPHLTVAENIFLGRMPVRGVFLDRRAMRAAARSVLDGMGVSLDVDTPVRLLSIAQQQLVEIAKATSRKARLIAMDEPSATLTEHEQRSLRALVRRLRAGGVAIVYITHRMDEVFELADRVTVLRDGRTIGTHAVSAITPGELIQEMVGRSLDDNFPKAAALVGEIALELRGLSRKGVLRDVSLSVRRGEVVALAGLIGSGRTEIARCVFGADRFDSGEILLDGKPFAPRSPRHAIRSGIGFVPEDRKGQGLVLPMTVRENVTLAALDRVSTAGTVSFRREREAAKSFVRTLGIRTPTVEQRAGDLSGGNQQKVALAKWLFRDARVLILDEPTRGIDVGAKVEIYQLINKLTAQGVAILMISSELPEVLGMADRIVVIRDGRVAGELSRAEATQEKVGRLAVGA